MTGKAVTQQSPVPLRLANQIQATGDKDAAEEVALEEAINKYVAEEADASTSEHTHHWSEN